jgi:3-oxoacyl-[acyl-carrier protein] reductase
MKKNKKVLITGGSSDIATPLIKKILNKTNYEIILSTFKNKSLYNDDRIIEINADFSDKNSILEFITRIREDDISYYVQLQGNVSENDTLKSLNYEDIIVLLNINMLSTNMILSELLQNMKKNNFGRIVLTSTASANFGGGQNSFMYGLAKHSASYTVKHLAKYYSEFGIIANAIAPGFIKTKFHTQVLKRDNSFLEEREKSIKVGYAGTPKDIANLIYNLTFENSFICGELIKIDGADFI